MWAHKITPEGDSVALSGLLNVRQGDETRQFDLRLSDGQVVLPMAQGPYGVDITLAEADDVSPMDRLSQIVNNRSYQFLKSRSGSWYSGCNYIVWGTMQETWSREDQR